MTISYKDAVASLITSEELAATMRAIFNLAVIAAKNLEPSELFSV
jgi:hypothetical protein